MRRPWGGDEGREVAPTSSPNLREEFSEASRSQDDPTTSYPRVLAVHLVLLDHLPGSQTAVVNDAVHLRPGIKLSLPVGDGGERSDNQERTPDADVVDFLQESDGLDGLAQAHLVGQNTVLPAGRETKRPVGDWEITSPVSPHPPSRSATRLLYQLKSNQLTPSSWYSRSWLWFLYSWESSSFFQEPAWGRG